MLRHLAFGLCAAAMLPASAHAQYIGGAAPPLPIAPPPGAAESPTAALARHIRTLAGSPRTLTLARLGYAALRVALPAATSLEDTLRLRHSRLSLC